MFPDLEPLPCPTFEDALGRVKAGDAKLAMIPIENSVAGRVADIHHLLPEAGLYIVGEHFLRVRHQLMALPGTPTAKIKRAMSHTQALGQCRNTLRPLGIEPVPAADTAGSRAGSCRSRSDARSGPSPLNLRPKSTAWKSSSATSRTRITTRRGSWCSRPSPTTRAR